MEKTPAPPPGGLAFLAHAARQSAQRKLSGLSVTKQQLRQQLRAARQAHVEALPAVTKALLFRRPPSPLLDMVPDGASVGLYHASPWEAPASGYAAFFAEAGHAIALPRFASPKAEMQFRAHTDPFGESDLERGAFDLLQPMESAPSLIPDVLIMPLLGFTAQGARIGQGGGHYDRWLAAHPQTLAIGLAWDCQLVEELPLEPHDIPLNAVITPTRFYGPF